MLNNFIYPLTNFPFFYFIDLVLVICMIWISWVEEIEFHISSFIQSNSLLKLQSYITSILYSEENDDYVLTISGYKVSSLVNNIHPQLRPSKCLFIHTHTQKQYNSIFYNIPDKTTDSIHIAIKLQHTNISCIKWLLKTQTL